MAQAAQRRRGGPYDRRW